jgi:hypothetical protein
MRRLKEVSLEKEEGMAIDEMVTFLLLTFVGTLISRIGDCY